MKKLFEEEIYKSSHFGMYIERDGKYGWTGENDKEGEFGLIEPNGVYEIALPHSCDEWSIAYGTPKKCLKDLDKFIKEAQELKKRLLKLV